MAHISKVIHIFKHYATHVTQGCIMYNQDFNELSPSKYDDYKRAVSYALDCQSYDNCVKLSNYLKRYQEECLLKNGVYPDTTQEFKEAQKSLREQLNTHITIKAMKPNILFVVIVPLLAAALGGFIGSVSSSSSSSTPDSTPPKLQKLPLTNQQKIDCLQSKW
jgi:hypothetical protein